MNNTKSHKPSFKLYAIGFSLSLILTVIAFGLVQLHLSSGHETFKHELIVPIILGLAFIQLLVQLMFFLHIGQESKPKWKLMAFLFGIMVVAIIFIGSIWIMYNLDYNMMHNKETDTKIIDDELIHKE
ncbi:cytochrome o ubiquinol oxidase subunit IV [Candidatus Saccharibacteria bacterium]|jgi:cytochrome o ubiquinol oxidase operon protein cyoD|nr:cytochrome o ubiquinol oxidase subunit IV [Candidatus Saccharibacteria bacterium]